MPKQIKLIMVTTNNNKFYNMKDLENGNFEVKYGRVGQSEITETYPISKWNSKYREKLRKGYQDVTELFAEETVKKDLIDISDNEISKIVNLLTYYANNTVKTHYNITSDKVTQKQINEAQSIIDELCSIIKNIKEDGLLNINDANKLLLDLYMVIPRRMSNVNNHLLKDNFTFEQLDKLIDSEQSILDTMAGQVSQHIAVTDELPDDNILDILGLEFYHIINEEKELILDKLGRKKYNGTYEDISNRFIKAFKVINKKTQKIYDEIIDKASNKTSHLFFHGSRSCNWWNIIQSGLLIRPSNAIHTGSMFGNGCYFASKARKSLGYTSLRDAYWSRGGDNDGFMALYDVHTGNQKHIKKHDSSCYSLNYDKINKEGYDSVYAEGGIDIVNSEYIIYRPEQCTIKYIIQLK